MSSASNGKKRPGPENDEERKRLAKERQMEHSLKKIESHLLAGFAKLHSTKEIVNQTKANIEMIGGIVSRQKEELKRAHERMKAVQPTNFRLTVVAEAACSKVAEAVKAQISELDALETTLADVHNKVTEPNALIHGPWPALPLIQARAEPKTHSRT